MRYWLMKSEPDVFSIDDLKARGKAGEPWDGIRNYQARNFMRDDMKAGDLALFYHSNCEVPGVVGIMKVTGEAEPDPAAWDKRSDYFDAKASPDNPRWVRVQVAFVGKFARTVSLSAMKEDAALEGMRVLQKGSRLSITPVDKAHFEHIVTLGGTA